MEVVQKVFRVTTADWGCLLPEVGNWIVANSAWEITSVSSQNLWLYNTNLGLSYYFELNSSGQTYISTCYTAEEGASGSNYVGIGQPSIASRHTDPIRTFQMTAFKDNGATIFVIGNYNSLSSPNFIHGIFPDHQAVLTNFQSGFSLATLLTKTGSTISSSDNITPLVTNVATPIGSIYISDVYFGNFSAFEDDLYPALKGYAGDGGVSGGITYAANEIGRASCRERV